MNKTDLKYICSINESDGKDRFLMTHALGSDYEDDFVFDTRHGIVWHISGSSMRLHRQFVSFLDYRKLPPLEAEAFRWAQSYYDELARKHDEGVREKMGIVEGEEPDDDSTLYL